MQLLPQQLIRMQSKGLITLPKKWREDIGVEDNGMVRIVKEPRRLIIEPVRTLPYPVRSYTDRELEEFFDSDAQEAKQLKAKGLIK